MLIEAGPPGVEFADADDVAQVRGVVALASSGGPVASATREYLSALEGKLKQSIKSSTTIRANKRKGKLKAKHRRQRMRATR